MDNYLLHRLRVDADHALELAKQQKELQHRGMKGRFRELVINNLLSPWLPPFCACGTGMIIESQNKVRESTQDDIIVYDTSLTPPILVSQRALEGVFLYNSVLLRIEVKSIANRQSIRDFISASLEIAALNVTVQNGCQRNFDGAYNLFLAFDSDAINRSDNYELERFVDVLKEYDVDPYSGIVSAICLPGRGFWKLGIDDGRRVWQRLQSNLPSDHLVWLVGITSSTSFKAHTERQGREWNQSLESGVGVYLPHPFESVELEIGS